MATWLRLVPAKVEFFVSADGVVFDKVGTVINTLPVNQYDSFLKGLYRFSCHVMQGM